MATNTKRIALNNRLDQMANKLGGFAKAVAATGQPHRSPLASRAQNAAVERTNFWFPLANARENQEFESDPLRGRSTAALNGRITMKSVICIVITILCALLLAFTGKNNWKLLPRAENLNKDDQVFYDGNSIIHKSNNIQITTKIVPGNKTVHDMAIIFKRKYNLNYERLKYSIQVKEVNCKEKKLRLLSFADYDMEDRKINSGDEPSKWDGFPPDSLNQQIYNVVCK